MMTVIVATVVLAAIAMNVIRVYGLPRWSVSLALLLLAILLHSLSVRIHDAFIRRRSPHLIDDEKGTVHSSATELVPRWVSHITSVVIAAVLAAVVPWLVLLARSLFN